MAISAATAPVAGAPRRLPGAQPAPPHDGLAVYDLGCGPPVLLMPYPQAAVSGPIAGGPLTSLLLGQGRRVITFHPPVSSEPARLACLATATMLDYAEATLAACGVDGPVPVVGHNLGGVCALALAIERSPLVAGLVLIGRLEARDRLEQIRVPVLVCAGRRDPRVPLGACQELVGRIPDARLRIFERSGHAPHLDEAACFRQALAGFLARL